MTDTTFTKFVKTIVTVIFLFFIITTRIVIIRVRIENISRFIINHFIYKRNSKNIYVEIFPKEIIMNSGVQSCEVSELTFNSKKQSYDHQLYTHKREELLEKVFGEDDEGLTLRMRLKLKLMLLK